MRFYYNKQFRIIVNMIMSILLIIGILHFNTITVKASGNVTDIFTYLHFEMKNLGVLF
ncbi:MAG: hypothetical protein K6G75_06315 [Lachnospiraceae bacterium]|nr:hypothetical protein [Lachnospiraceae bacterium]